jgi:hypothetical protein
MRTIAQLKDETSIGCPFWIRVSPQKLVVNNALRRCLLNDPQEGWIPSNSLVERRKHLIGVKTRGPRLDRTTLILTDISMWQGKVLGKPADHVLCESASKM